MVLKVTHSTGEQEKVGSDNVSGKYCKVRCRRQREREDEATSAASEVKSCWSFTPKAKHICWATGTCSIRSRRKFRHRSG